MKYVLLTGALLMAAATTSQANPWDVVPPTAPQKSIADEIKATARPGQPSPLNPSCEGKTGDACVRSAQATQNQQSERADAPKPRKKPRN